MVLHFYTKCGKGEVNLVGFCSKINFRCCDFLDIYKLLLIVTGCILLYYQKYHHYYLIFASQGFMLQIPFVVHLLLLVVFTLVI